MLKKHPIPYATHHINGLDITIKRLDLVHPTISGNKFFKLQYNLAYVEENDLETIVSFGGAYSNHIYALAHACHAAAIKSVGYIRGEELADKPLNATLQKAHDLGMRLEFISRSDYRRKHSDEFIAQLHNKHPNAHIIPEGGSNALAIKGTTEILTQEDKNNFDVIVCAVGTGGTITGIINASDDKQSVIGISALNSTYQADYIQQHSNKHNWHIFSDDVFGGYAKYNQHLLTYIDDINDRFDVPLEPIYTAKAFYRLTELIDTLDIPTNSRILFIHTGGLQAFQTTSRM